MDSLPLVVQPPQTEDASVVEAAGVSSDPIAGARVEVSWRSSHAVQESLGQRELLHLRIKDNYE